MTFPEIEIKWPSLCQLPAIPFPKIPTVNEGDLGAAPTEARFGGVLAMARLSAADNERCRQAIEAADAEFASWGPTAPEPDEIDGLIAFDGTTQSDPITDIKACLQRMRSGR